MLSICDAAEVREVRFPVMFSKRDIDAMAETVGFPVTDDEAAAILDHIDREFSGLARSATEIAIQRRIGDLVRSVQTTYSR